MKIVMTLKHLLATLLAFAALASHAGALTDFAENKIVDALARGQALGAPATWYIGLDTVACTEAGGGTEVTGGSYARAAIAASLVNWAGNAWVCTPLTVSKTINSGDTVSFPASTLSLQIDN